MQLLSSSKWRHNTRHNDLQHNDTRRKVQKNKTFNTLTTKAPLFLVLSDMFSLTGVIVVKFSVIKSFITLCFQIVKSYFDRIFRQSLGGTKGVF